MLQGLTSIRRSENACLQKLTPVPVNSPTAASELRLISAVCKA